jgi:hypothetical protein
LAEFFLNKLLTEKTATMSQIPPLNLAEKNKRKKKIYWRNIPPLHRKTESRTHLLAEITARKSKTNWFNLVAECGQKHMAGLSEI